MRYLLILCACASVMALAQNATAQDGFTTVRPPQTAIPPDQPAEESAIPAIPTTPVVPVVPTEPAPAPRGYAAAPNCAPRVVQEGSRTRVETRVLKKYTTVSTQETVEQGPSYDFESQPVLEPAYPAYLPQRPAVCPSLRLPPPFVRERCGPAPMCRMHGCPMDRCGHLHNQLHHRPHGYAGGYGHQQQYRYFGMNFGAMRFGF